MTNDKNEIYRKGYNDGKYDAFREVEKIISDVVGVRDYLIPVVSTILDKILELEKELI